MEPVTFPPMTYDRFRPEMLEPGRDEAMSPGGGAVSDRRSRPRLLYLKFHGLPDQPYLYGDEWATAISATQIRGADLAGVVVYAPTCWLPQTPVLTALLEAGAEAVIAGYGSNFAYSRGRHALGGADLLGWFLRRFFSSEESGIEGVATALGMAKRAVEAMSRPRSAAEVEMLADTLAFRVFTSGQED